MVFRVTYDDNGNVVTAERWFELSIPPSEKELNPDGVKFDHVAWVEANDEEEAIIKAKKLRKEG